MTAADEITYVDAAPAIPGRLGTDAPHVHHRESDRCLRAPDGVACPTPAELRAEVARLRASDEKVRNAIGTVTAALITAEAERDRLAAIVTEAALETYTPDGSERFVGAFHKALAERDALQQQVANAKAEGWDECVEALAWCLDNGSPHGAPKYLHDNNPHRAALGGPASPTPEPTIADHDGFGAPIMDHAQEPQPTPWSLRHIAALGESVDRARQREIDNMPCPRCGGDRLRADFTESKACHAARQQEPVERITDDRGDELEHGEHEPGECSVCDAARQQCSCLPRDAEATLTCPVHGADTDAEAANQPKCTCVPFPQGTGPEEDCPVHGARQQGGGDR